MSAVEDVDRLIERYRLALGAFLKGAPEPAEELWSHKVDVSIANPYGPPVRGWDGIVETAKHAASLRRDGKIPRFEIVSKVVTAELAYVVFIERAQAKVGDREDITPFTLRVTMIFRPEEEGEWKVVHRHADPTTTARPAESVIQE